MMANTPDSIANHSPDSVHVRGSDSSHQQVVHIGDKAKYYLLALSITVCAVSLMGNAILAYIIYCEKYSDQNRYDWLQREVIMPLQGQVNEHDKEIQALMNHQEKR